MMIAILLAAMAEYIIETRVVIYNAGYVQVCKTTSDPNTMECIDKSYEQQLDYICKNWLQENGTNLQDFNVLSGQWQRKSEIEMAAEILEDNCE